MATGGRRGRARAVIVPETEPDEAAPRGWTVARLADAVPVLRTGPFGSALHKADYVRGGVPLINPANITNSDLSPDAAKTVGPDTLERLAPWLMRPGDVVVGRRGEMGRAAVVPSRLPAWLCGTGCAFLRPGESVDSAFLAFWFGSPAVRARLEAAAVGATMSNLSARILGDLAIALPPIAEQKRIVEKVEALLARVNAARERLTRVRDILKRFRQSVLAAACSGRLTEEWRQAHSERSGCALLEMLLTERPKRLAEDQCARTSGRSNKYRPPEQPFEGDGLPGVPDGWAWASLDALTFKIVDGVHKTPHYVDAGVPFVTVRNLTAGPGIDLAQLKYVTRKDHLHFIDRANPARGDLLISKDGTLGVVRAVRTDDEFSVFVSVALAKPVTADLTDFLELILMAPQIQQRMVPTGSGLQHLHLRDLKTVPVPLPSLSEQREIVHRVEALFATAGAIERRLAAAVARSETFLQATLAKAFRGELVPPELQRTRAAG
jgi:type I restriction enzyme S subunit